MSEPALHFQAQHTPPLRAEIALKSSEFRRGREASWRELERLIGRVDHGGVRALAADELQRLPLLYRTALSSLAVARSIALDRNLLLYLENLSLRAYLAVYGPRIGIWQGIGEFLNRGFPAAVRAARGHLLIAALTLLAGAVVGFSLTVADEAWYGSFVPSGLAGGRGPASTRQELLDDEIFGPAPSPIAALAVFANFLFRNNTMVGILSFSLGFAAGVPTLLLLFWNGTILGAFVALHYDRGLTLDILGWLSVHGVTEITALVLCGGAGLMIADKALFPGRYTRVESLARQGRVAARVAVGAVFMFFVAALLEGGVRQQVADTGLRFMIGGVTGLLWLAYFLRRGGEPAP